MCTDPPTFMSEVIKLSVWVPSMTFTIIIHQSLRHDMFQCTLPCKQGYVNITELDITKLESKKESHVLTSSFWRFFPCPVFFFFLFWFRTNKKIKRAKPISSDARLKDPDTSNVAYPFCVIILQVGMMTTYICEGSTFPRYQRVSSDGSRVA